MSSSAQVSDSAADASEPLPAAQQREAEGGSSGPAPPADSPAAVVVQVALAAFASIAFGLTIGYPTFYFVFDGLSRTCVDFTAQEACEAPPHAGCVWTAALGAQPAGAAANGTGPAASCKYADFETVYCPQYTAQDSCKEQQACVFNFGDDACEHAVCMTSLQTGLFVTGQPAGAVVASITANYALDRVRLRPLLLASAALTSVGAVFLHVGRATDVFGVLVLGRFVSGVGAAALRKVASIMPYVILGPGPAAGRVTSVIQPMTECGILVVALLTYFGPSDMAKDTNIEGTIHGSIAALHVAAVAVAITCVFLREPPLPDGQRGSVPLPPGGLFLPLAKFPGKAGLLAAAPACFIATGLYGFSVLSPLYSREAWSIEPSFAPLVMQLFAAGFGLLSFLLRRIFVTPRPVFLTGTFISCAASIAFGVTVSPSVGASADLRQGLGLAVAGVFYFALQCFVGSALFEVGLNLLPSNLRGSAATVLDSLFNFYAAVFSFVFPIAIVAMSGGPSGNILEGLSIMYYIMGSVGVLCGIVGVVWMHPHDGTHVDDGGNAGDRTVEDGAATESTTAVVELGEIKEHPPK